MRPLWSAVLFVFATLAAAWAVRLRQRGESAWRLAVGPALLAFGAGLFSLAPSIVSAGVAFLTQLIALYLILSFRPGRRRDMP